MFYPQGITHTRPGLKGVEKGILCGEMVLEAHKTFSDLLRGVFPPINKCSYFLSHLFSPK
jgi:hypothetical protein